MKITQAKNIRGELNLPGDKSISHRAAMLSAMAEGKTLITNFSTGEDCRSTLGCLRQLGVGIKRDGANVMIEGVGKRGFRKPEAPLDCGNSGTTMRLLAGILAGQNFASVLTGDNSLSTRPMGRIIKPLKLMGAEIDSDGEKAPLSINARSSLNSIRYELPIASAQIKSCVLLAGLNASGISAVTDPISKKMISSSRDHTERMLKYLGARVEEKFARTKGGFSREVLIDGNSRLTAKDIKIPADISSAAFFIAAASPLKGSELILKDVGLNPTRSAVIDVLQSFGADILVENKREFNNEIFGDLKITGNRSNRRQNASNKIDGDMIANLIDEIPVLAVFGTQLEGGLEIRNAEELRVKESDRICATVENLRKMGARVEEFPDGMKVERSHLKGAEIDSFDDHRIAMAFAVAGIFAEGETIINNSDCAKISFPEFFETLESIVR